MWSVGRAGVWVIGRDNFCEASFTSLEVYVAVLNVHIDENCFKAILSLISSSDPSISILKRLVGFS